MSNDITTSLWTFFVVNNGNEKFPLWFDCQPWQQTRKRLKSDSERSQGLAESTLFYEWKDGNRSQILGAMATTPAKLLTYSTSNSLFREISNIFIFQAKKKTFQHQDCNCSIVKVATVIEYLLSYRRFWIAVAAGSDGHCLTWNFIVVAIGTTIRHNEKFAGH